MIIIINFGQQLKSTKLRSTTTSSQVLTLCRWLLRRRASGEGKVMTLSTKLVVESRHWRISRVRQRISVTIQRSHVFCVLETFKSSRNVASQRWTFQLTVWFKFTKIGRLINPHILTVILVTFVLKGGGKTIPMGISASRLAKNKMSTATPMFSGSNVSMVLLKTLPDETGCQNPRWRLK